jgi:hypothetical protein
MTAGTVPPSAATSSAPGAWPTGPAHAPALAAFPPSSAARQRSITPPPAVAAGGAARSSWAGAGAGGGGRGRGGWADDGASLDLSAASAPSLAPTLSAFPSAAAGSPARAPDGRGGRGAGGGGGGAGGPSRPDSRLEQLEVQLAAVEMGDSLRGRTRSSDQDGRAGPGFADVPTMVGRAAAGGSKLMRM